MSVVERALSKLQQRKAAEAAREPVQPLARIARNDPARTARRGLPAWTETSLGRSIEFDFNALDEAGLIAAGNERLADQYRHIKQPLLKTAAGRSGPAQDARNRLLMVSSALEGEGKTFTSVNLSLSLAVEKDWRVLLVDADCKSPKLSQLLGLGEQPGLLDLLRNPDLDLESVVFATNIKGLSVLALGHPDEHPTELLASARMTEICTRLAGGPDDRLLVVFDSSPLLLTSEADVLAAQMGQIVVVVRANETPRNAVEQALEMLDAEKSIGLILNRAHPHEEALAYGKYGVYGAYGPYNAA